VPEAQGCKWRNTTNSTTCMSAQVGEYQHALAWNSANSLEIFVGNDSGLWRSIDGIGESGSVCSPSDASHFQNLNGNLGSLAEVESISQTGATPYTMMAGLGQTEPLASKAPPGRRRTGRRSWAARAGRWPSIQRQRQLVRQQPGGSLHLSGHAAHWKHPRAFSPVLDYTTDPGATTPLASGAVAIADVVRDGLSMAVEPPYAPADFLADRSTARSY